MTHPPGASTFELRAGLSQQWELRPSYIGGTRGQGLRGIVIHDGLARNTGG